MDTEELLATLRREHDGLVVHGLRGMDDLVAARRGVDDRRAFESAQAALGAGQEAWSVGGVCLVCDGPRLLRCDWLYAPPGRPNWRERLLCPSCGLNNRQRFMAHLVGRVLAGRERPAVYLHEQVTDFYAWAVRSLPAEVVGSEYLGAEVAGGTEVDGIRHEDALALTFGDGSLDVIVSNDVLEHVPDLEAALREAARVLRPGGALVFSVPFHSGSAVSRRRAELGDDGVRHLLEPEWHGNPVDPQGSLVFTDIGWDVLGTCRAAGFADALVIGFWSAVHAHLGEGLQMVFLATR